jgi:hypothetical protein
VFNKSLSTMVKGIRGSKDKGQVTDVCPRVTAV